MKIFNGINELDQPLTRSVVTIGNFDGVHRGHQAIMSTLLKSSKAQKTPSIVMTFDPHPMQVLFPEKKLKRLFPREDQVEQLQRLGIDILIIEPFSRALSALKPEIFLAEKVVEPLSPTKIIVGYDFSFGANRSGGIADLQKFATQKNIEVQVVEAIKIENVVASSSKVRDCLKQHDIVLASKILGRNFYIMGLVEKGDARGREMNFQTANLYVQGETVPANGVYATRTWLGQDVFESVTNVGSRPTFQDDPTKIQVETHILNFDKSIYGERIKVEFVAFLREEKKFSGITELKIQIAKDIEETKKILKAQK